MLLLEDIVDPFVSNQLQCVNNGTITLARCTGGAQPPSGITRVTLMTTAPLSSFVVSSTKNLNSPSKWPPVGCGRPRNGHWHAVYLLCVIIIVLLIIVFIVVVVVLTRFVQYMEQLDAVPTKVPK